MPYSKTCWNACPTRCWVQLAEHTHQIVDHLLLHLGGTVVYWNSWIEVTSATRWQVYHGVLRPIFKVWWFSKICKSVMKIAEHSSMKIFIPPPNEVGGGVYWIHLVRPSVCPSVRPSVCRRHGFRSISQVCFGISISNFICMLMVAIGRSLLIFSVVTFKMAAWQPYWIFWFPDSNFSLAFNINFKLQRHNTYVYG